MKTTQLIRNFFSRYAVIDHTAASVSNHSTYDKAFNAIKTSAHKQTIIDKWRGAVLTTRGELVI